MKHPAPPRTLLLLVLPLLLAGVLLLASTGGRHASVLARLPVFSFIQGLDRVTVTGLAVVRPALGAFAAGYPIKNPNYFPSHAGAVQELNWQVGILVSAEKKQVETHAALHTPPGLTLTSPEIRAAAGMVFEGHTAAVRRSGPVRAEFLLEVLDRAGAVLSRHAWGAGPEQGWRSFAFPLDAYAGRRIRLRLSATAEPGVFPLWGEPLVSGPGMRPGPNVLVILVDAVRADILGGNGSRLGLTPNIDRYARRGVNFSRAFANANWTRPSELSLFTGVYPRRLRINLLDFPVSADELDHFYRQARFATLPDLFRQRGYRTRGVINNIFLQAFTGTGVDIGFDHVSDFRTLNRDTVDITEETLAWVRARKDAPWFAFCNYNSPHKPYSAPETFFRQIKDDRRWRFEKMVKDYLAEVAFADHWIGKLLDGLAADGSLDNTIVVITADHGEVMWPWHNHSTVYSDYTRFGHSLTMLDEELHVPLVMFGPGITARGERRDIVQLVDLLPTLVRLSGGSLPAGQPVPVDGRDLSSVLAGGAPLAERPVYAQGMMLEGLRTTRYKYIWRPPGFDKVGPLGGPPDRHLPEELYDLQNDPQERTNIAAVTPGVLSNMRSLSRGYRDTRTAGTLLLRWPPGVRAATIGLVGEGTFFDLPEVTGGSRTLSPDGKTLIITARRGRGDTLALRWSIHPDFAPLSFRVLLDGRPLASPGLFVGKAGAALLGPGMRISRREEFLAAVSPDRPLPYERGLPGVYFFRDPPEAAIRYSSDTTRLSTEIKTVLRDWGYIQK